MPKNKKEAIQMIINTVCLLALMGLVGGLENGTSNFNQFFTLLLLDIGVIILNNIL